MKNTSVKNFMLLDGKEIVLLVNEKFYPSKKWTCVKFASGQIEWVTTSRLTKNIHTRAIEFIIGMGFSWNSAANWYVFIYFFGMALISGTAGFLLFALSELISKQF